MNHVQNLVVGFLLFCLTVGTLAYASQTPAQECASPQLIEMAAAQVAREAGGVYQLREAHTGAHVQMILGLPEIKWEEGLKERTYSVILVLLSDGRARTYFMDASDCAVGGMPTTPDLAAKIADILDGEAA